MAAVVRGINEGIFHPFFCPISGTSEESHLS